MMLPQTLQLRLPGSTEHKWFVSSTGKFPPLAMLARGSGEALARLPALRERRVVVVNMAQGSGKEPQQLLELAYLLALGQRLDLAIALDGFNELALGHHVVSGRIERHMQ